jgi:hypothetical protein
MRGRGRPGRERVRALLVASLALAAPQLGRAQSLGGGVLAYRVEHRVLIQGSVLEQTGLWVGLEGSARWGPLRVGLAGLMGSLSAGEADSARPTRDARATTVSAVRRLADWAEAGLEVEARRFGSDAGTVVWRLAGLTARATPAMGLRGLEGLLEVSSFPLAGVSGADYSVKLALRGMVGLRYAPPPGRWVLRLAYRFERFEFEPSGAASPGADAERLEQFRGLVVGAGVHLARR